MEITPQADYYGLPERHASELPSAEKVADLLAAPTPWQRPLQAGLGDIFKEPEGYDDWTPHHDLHAPRPDWDHGDKHEDHAKFVGDM